MATRKRNAHDLAPGTSKAIERGIRAMCSADGTIAYRAEVYDNAVRKTAVKTVPTLAAARNWRDDMKVKIRSGEATAASSPTLAAYAGFELCDGAWVETGDGWMADARAGKIRSRKGGKYTDATLRSYEGDLRLRVMPTLGHRKLKAIDREEIQNLIEGLQGTVKDGTVRNTITALMALFRRATMMKRQTGVVNDPTRNLVLPTPGDSRQRIATPEEAELLLSLVPEGDRALWACAFYAGLRAGEIMALRWEDVDLAKGVLVVWRSYDPKAKAFKAAKTKAGTGRSVFIAAPFARELAKLDRTDGLVFGKDGVKPFVYTSLRNRALAAWAQANAQPIGLHECRHTFASIAIAAGLNAKTLCEMMGHSSVSTTFDLYGKLMPGHEGVARELFDAYLDGAAA